jgi:hypothetical protein
MINVLHKLTDRLSNTATREVLEALAGRKVSRIALSENHIPWLENIIHSMNGSILKGYEPFLHQPDQGKGDWSSKSIQTKVPNHLIPSWQLFIAKEEKHARLARDLEMYNEEKTFGMFLGIPECCAEFYVQNRHNAMKIQNDFTLFSAINSPHIESLPFWTNTLTQYFGSTLISFAPCSFTCPHAIKVAMNNYEHLKGVSVPFANIFLAFHKLSGIYSEYEGIHIFPAQQVNSNLITYEFSSLKSTAIINSELSYYLKLGNHIKFTNFFNFEILNGHKPIKKYNNSDFIFLYFN